VVSEQPICENCKQAGKSIDIYLQHKQKLCELDQRYSLHWTECQSCMDNDQLDIICENMDCKIFYKRIKIRKDLEEQRLVMRRFEMSE